MNNKEEIELNEEGIINQIRSLGIDMIKKANSGHPGIVLGAAPIIYALYAKHLRIDPKDPNYFNRDRFVLSAGHGSALLYATLHMAGFDISLEDLKEFRQIDSITPGHPEYLITPGVDATTGPLGQGIGMAVGMAIAGAYLNKKYPDLIDYYTYCLCGDGDLMEGISYEAFSLAGTLALNKLIVLYDSNNICLDGNTSMTFNEDISSRFTSQGWNYLKVQDGENHLEIDKAIIEAKKSNKPTLIEVKTTIGKYSLNEGTNKVHGAPLTDEDMQHVKEKLNVRDVSFAVSQKQMEEFQKMINDRCLNLSLEFQEKLSNSTDSIKEEIEKLMSDDKSIDMKNFYYETPKDLKEAPRDTSSKILNAIIKDNFYTLGGSADLFSSNKTYIKEGGDFSKDNYLGKNIYFGVREHAMASIINGIALCGLRPYASTFLSFSDYLKPALRLSSMMNLANIYIFTHDSLSVGEDGPTHQPMEQLLMLRSLPNMDVFRPADANEVIGSYKAIFNKTNGPASIILSKKELPILEETKASEVEKGAYIVLDTVEKPTGIIISSGEELHASLEVSRRLKTKGIDIRVVSMPSIDRFLKQDEEYIEKILPVEVRKIVVESSSSMSWNKLIYNSKYLITLDEFGTSGKSSEVLKKYGFDVASLEEKIEELLK